MIAKSLPELCYAFTVLSRVLILKLKKSITLICIFLKRLEKSFYDLLSFESEKLEVQISGSNFHVLLYSPIKLDIVLVTRPEHGSSINFYVPIPIRFSKYTGILNIKQDAEWSLNNCFLLCVGLHRLIKKTKIDITKFLINGGVEIVASDHPDLRDFVMNNKKYDHIDKYQKMIEHEFPSMTINIFIHDEGSKPLIYNRFGVGDGKTEEVNLLLQGDLKKLAK